MLQDVSGIAGLHLPFDIGLGKVRLLLESRPLGGVQLRAKS